MPRTLAFVLLLSTGACSDAEDSRDERAAHETSDTHNAHVKEAGDTSSTTSAAKEASNDGSVVLEVAPVTVKPQSEAMFCHYLPPLEEDLVVRGFKTRQSPGGHHMVMYRALMQKPAGTVEDCSTGESMSNLMLALTQTGTQEPGASEIEFPKDHVVVLRAGTQFVAQSHYINTTSEPLTGQDVMTLHTTKADLATLTQLRLYVITTIEFSIPPGGADYSASASCDLEYPIRFLSFTPHMHEWGTHIEVGAGKHPAMKNIVDVREWTPDMRDLAPVTSFSGADAPSDGHYAAGQTMKLTCSWRNTSPEPLKFPNEMCAAVGYFTSDAPEADDILCLQTLRDWESARKAM